MTRTLDSLITEANSVFHGDFVWTQYQLAVPTTRPVELLAQYLVAEMRDLYDPGSSDRANLNRFIVNLEVASARLEGVTQCLRDLRQASLATSHALTN